MTPPKPRNLIDDALHERIDRLSQEQAAFLLKSLLLAGHVSGHVMGQGLGLAETLRSY